MPRIKTIDIDPANVDPNGLCAALPTGSSWTLAGDAEFVAVSAGDGLAHQLIVTTAGNEPAGNSAIMTITGTDADDRAISEAITLPNATTIESTLYFKTIDSTITTDAATIGTVDVGWVDEVSTKTFPLNRHSATGAHVQVDVTGTIDFSVQITNKSLAAGADQDTLAWVAPQDADFTTTTADTVGYLDIHANAMRLIVNSYTDTAEIQLYISQGYK